MNCSETAPRSGRGGVGGEFYLFIYFFGCAESSLLCKEAAQQLPLVAVSGLLIEGALLTAEHGL